MNTSHGGRKGLVTFEIAPASLGAATNGAGVDMQGYDRVVFHAMLGVMGANATFDMYAVESTLANFSGQTNVTGAAITQVSNAQANTVVSIDVTRATKRYVRVVATPGTANTVFGVLSERFRGTGTLPIALPTNHQYVVAAEN